MEQIKLPKPLTWEEIQGLVPETSLYYIYNMMSGSTTVASVLCLSASRNDSAADLDCTGFYLHLEEANYVYNLYREDKLFFNEQTESWELKEDQSTTVTVTNAGYVTEVDMPWSDNEEESILLKAYSIVNGSRSVDYKGTEGFEKISQMWNILYPNKPLDAKDIAMLMVVLKMVRESVSHKEDNIVDACGYLYFVNELSK